MISDLAVVVAGSLPGKAGEDRFRTDFDATCMDEQSHKRKHCGGSDGLLRIIKDDKMQEITSLHI